MTNQEIFDEIGEMGTLLLLFIEMAAADGEVTEEEANLVVKAATCFTDNDVSDNIDAALKFRNSLTMEARVGYLAAGLGYFAGNLAAETKTNILYSLAVIADLDGSVNNSESALFKMAYSYLKA